MEVGGVWGRGRYFTDTVNIAEEVGGGGFGEDGNRWRIRVLLPTPGEPSTRILAESMGRKRGKFAG